MHGVVGVSRKLEWRFVMLLMGGATLLMSLFAMPVQCAIGVALLLPMGSPPEKGSAQSLSAIPRSLRLRFFRSSLLVWRRLDASAYTRLPFYGTPGTVLLSVCHLTAGGLEPLSMLGGWVS